MLNALLVTFLGTAPAVDVSPAPPPPVVEAAPVSLPSVELPKFGMYLDAGVPDGVGLSVAYRPLPWLRVHAGGIFNVISPGVRGGVTFSPIDFVIRPTATLEAGHFFQGDARWILGDGASGPGSEVLSAVSYSFGNAHLGFELGSRNVAFLLRGGISYLDGSLPNALSGIASPRSPSSSQAVHLRVLGPSAKLGLVVYFL
jgi:hypothetical protein